MFQNSESAKYISEMFLAINGQLNESVEAVESSCTTDEFLVYRRRVGVLINSVFETILVPLYREHPELKPDGLEI
jgi:hypothetical protein